MVFTNIDLRPLEQDEARGGSKKKSTMLQLDTKGQKKQSHIFDLGTEFQVSNVPI